MGSSEGSSGPCKLLVFGGTTPVGNVVIEKAIKQGFRVTALTRHPFKIETRHKRLRVVLGDLLKPSSLLLATDEPFDAVVSCVTKFVWPHQGETDFFVKSMKQMVWIMKRRGIKRLITLTSWCLRNDPKYVWYMKWFVKPLYSGAVLKSMALMEDYLTTTDSQDVHYTIVRPTCIRNSAAKNEFIIAEDCEYIENVRCCISQEDVANFILKLTQCNEHLRKAVAIANQVPQT